MEMTLKMYSLGFQVSRGRASSANESMNSFTVSHCPGLLRLVVQSFRLFRRGRIHHRDGSHEHSRDATARRFRFTLRPVAQGIQSHQVSARLRLGRHRKSN